MEIIIRDIDHIAEAAQRFCLEMADNTVFAFYGKMGAGKTTFIKAVCEHLGVSDTVTSPTFAIVNEYQVSTPCTGAPTRPGDTIYHFDFYRIRRPEEIFDIGYEEYIDSGNICFMEWPELMEEYLPADAVKVTIEEQADGSRVVRI